MRRTIRGWKHDRVHVVADVDPLDVPLGRKPTRYVYVTSRDTMLAEYACAMLTPAAALKLADAIRDAARVAARPVKARRKR